MDENYPASRFTPRILFRESILWLCFRFNNRKRESRATESKSKEIQPNWNHLAIKRWNRKTPKQIRHGIESKEHQSVFPRPKYRIPRNQFISPSRFPQRFQRQSTDRLSPTNPEDSAALFSLQISPIADSCEPLNHNPPIRSVREIRAVDSAAFVSILAPFASNLFHNQNFAHFSSSPIRSANPGG